MILLLAERLVFKTIKNLNYQLKSLKKIRNIHKTTKMLEKFANTKNDFKSEGVSRKKYLSVFSKSVDQLGYASSFKKISFAR